MLNVCDNCLFEYACMDLGPCSDHDQNIGFDPYLDLLPGVESLLEDQPF